MEKQVCWLKPSNRFQSFLLTEHLLFHFLMNYSPKKLIGFQGTKLPRDLPTSTIHFLKCSSFWCLSALPNALSWSLGILLHSPTIPCSLFWSRAALLQRKRGENLLFSTDKKYLHFADGKERYNHSYYTITVIAIIITVYFEAMAYWIINTKVFLPAKKNSIRLISFPLGEQPSFITPYPQHLISSSILIVLF